MAASVTKKSEKSPYSLHPSFAMEATGLVNLKARTGMTLDQWIKRIKKDGPKTLKERHVWLMEEGLTTNYARWVAERADGKGAAADYDPEAYVEAMFAGKKVALRPLYDKLLKIGLSVSKEVKACPCQTMVPLFRKHVIAQIKPTTNTRIDMGFALKDMKPTGRLIDTGGFKKKDRITHRIEVSSMEDIDGEIERWLKKAFALDA